MEISLIPFHSIAIRIDKLLKLSLSDFAHVAELRCTHGAWTCEVMAVEDRMNAPTDRDEEGGTDNDEDDVAEEDAAYVHSVIG